MQQLLNHIQDHGELPTHLIGDMASLCHPALLPSYNHDGVYMMMGGGPLSMAVCWQLMQRKGAFHIYHAKPNNKPKIAKAIHTLCVKARGYHGGPLASKEIHWQSWLFTSNLPSLRTVDEDKYKYALLCCSLMETVKLTVDDTIDIVWGSPWGTPHLLENMLWLTYTFPNVHHHFPLVFHKQGLFLLMHAKAVYNSMVSQYGKKIVKANVLSPGPCIPDKVLSYLTTSSCNEDGTMEGCIADLTSLCGECKKCVLLKEGWRKLFLEAPLTVPTYKPSFVIETLPPRSRILSISVKQVGWWSQSDSEQRYLRQLAQEEEDEEDEDEENSEDEEEQSDEEDMSEPEEDDDGEVLDEDLGINSESEEDEFEEDFGEFEMDAFDESDGELDVPDLDDDEDESSGGRRKKK
jgi:hypothetical protein